MGLCGSHWMIVHFHLRNIGNGYSESGFSDLEDKFPRTLTRA